MQVHLTETAAQHIQGVLKKHPEGKALRLGVKKTGCSGYAYVVSVADAIHPEDVLLHAEGLPIVVEKTDIPKLDGITLDFVNQGLNRHFEFHNPQAEHYCGCGESFTLKSNNDN